MDAVIRPLVNLRHTIVREHYKCVQAEVVARANICDHAVYMIDKVSLAKHNQPASCLLPHTPSPAFQGEEDIRSLQFDLLSAYMAEDEDRAKQVKEEMQSIWKRTTKHSYVDMLVDNVGFDYACFCLQNRLRYKNMPIHVLCFRHHPKWTPCSSS